MQLLPVLITLALGQCCGWNDNGGNGHYGDKGPWNGHNCDPGPWCSAQQWCCSPPCKCCPGSTPCTAAVAASWRRRRASWEPPGWDCWANTCPPPPTTTCSDGEQNGDETDTDCGGSCPACTCPTELDGETKTGMTGKKISIPQKAADEGHTKACCKHDSVPMTTCLPDKTSGFANVDMDAISDQKVSVQFKKKDAHTDSDNVDHPATVGDFTYQADNGRYVIDQAQPENVKSIKITVSRPKDLLEFGGEWVKMYEKDSWKNITNEYEPYTFNDFGSKVALKKFRPTTENEHGQMIVDDANATDELNVFMELSKNGDYEIRYGNPQLITEDGKWVALEFKDHQLRVGDPFASTDAYDHIGTIIPVYLGNPALLIADYKSIAKTMKDAIATAAHTKKVAVKVILPIFTPDTVSADGLTEETDLNEVDSGRNGWTEGKETESERLTAWECDSTWTEGKTQNTDNGCVKTSYKGCYSSGKACTMDHSVCEVSNCEINKWKEIIAAFQEDDNGASTGIEVIGLIETKKATGTARDTIDIKNDIDKYKTYTPVKGFYFNEVITKKTVTDDATDEEKTVKDLIAISLEKIETEQDKGTYFTVFGLGQPLFQSSDLIDATKTPGAPDVWVTLNDEFGELGVWTPYSWFSSVPSTAWAAIVNSVPTENVTKTLDLLFDRGYGYVYLHQDSLFNETSGHLDNVIKGIGGKKNPPARRQLRGRGLQTQDDGVETTKYECDDTLFECQPVCVRTKGVTRSKVSDEKCSGVKPTQCSCRCYYDAYWTCENDAVVCKASMSGGGARTVGDLVCITRGTPKPDWDPTAQTTQTRTVGQCKPLEVERTRKPTDQCLAEYAAPPAEPAQPKEVEVAETPEAPTTTVAPVIGTLPELELMGSAVHVAVGVALLALA